MDTEVAYRVVIECPTTEREVDTGLSMSLSEFEHPSVRHSTVQCPHCRERHEYDIWDAWLKIDDCIEAAPRR